MKKVLALVLAVMMLATTAFALDVGNPGAAGVAWDDVEPGSSIKIYPGAFAKETGAMPSEATFTSEFFTITAKKFSKGADLVKEVKWNDDDECVEIVLKDNFDLASPEKANLIIDTLKVKCKKEVKDGDDKLVGKNTTWEYVGDINHKNDFGVGYKLGEVTIKEDMDLLVVDSGVTSGLDLATGRPGGNLTDTKLVKFKAGDEYGTVNIEFDDIAYASGRVYKNDKVFLGYDQKVNVDLVKKYPDADLTFLNLHATFNSTMDFEIYADEGSYIYALKDGKLSATNLKWDDDAYAFTGKVRSMGSYVISDTKLAVEATAGTNNPDTGANDVVGIATALAAVALVSAAAVSLKK